MSNLHELYKLRNILLENNDLVELEKVDAMIVYKEFLLEDTATAVSAGMGDVSAAQPSSLPGSLNGDTWSQSGGSIGSGDIPVPYNASSKNKTFQKFSMGKSHGAMTGKKARKQKNEVRNKPQKPKKVMRFNDFTKKDMETITRVKD